MPVVPWAQVTTPERPPSGFAFVGHDDDARHRDVTTVDRAR